jgi:hypothetical protein
MSAEYWDSADLKAIQAGGLINEDVMQKIFDISEIPLPFSDAVGRDTHDNSYAEWTKDKLAAPDITNARVSGADASGNQAKGGERVGNHGQIPDKVLKVTQRARNSGTIGRTDELSYQLLNRGKEIRRDVEAICLTPQASVEDNGDAVAGRLGGLDAWLETNVSVGATGAVGGFNPTTKIVTAPTAGTLRPLSYAFIGAQLDSVYANNGTPTTLMSVPQLIRRLATFLTANADGLLATPTANVSGSAPAEMVAQGYTSILKTDYGFTMRLVPNRLQQPTAANTATLFGIEPGGLMISFQQGSETAALGKPGLSDQRQISADLTLKVGNEEAHFSVRDLNYTVPVVA